MTDTDTDSQRKKYRQSQDRPEVISKRLKTRELHRYADQPSSSSQQLQYSEAARHANYLWHVVRLEPKHHRAAAMTVTQPMDNSVWTKVSGASPYPGKNHGLWTGIVVWRERRQPLSILTATVLAAAEPAGVASVALTTRPNSPSPSNVDESRHSASRSNSQRQSNSCIVRVYTSDVNEARWAWGQGRGRGQKGWGRGRSRDPKFFSRPRPDTLENNSVCMSMKTKILAYRT